MFFIYRTVIDDDYLTGRDVEGADQCLLCTSQDIDYTGECSTPAGINGNVD